MSVIIETTLGDLTVDLFTEARPRCTILKLFCRFKISFLAGCLNFLKLCKIKYYNMCTFHSIEADYIAQTGDPTGTGRGGESIFGCVLRPQHSRQHSRTQPTVRHASRLL